MSDLFCSKPFERFEVSRRQGGLVHLCCSAWLSRSVGNLKDQSVDEVWNSQAAQEIRASVHDGSFRYCNKQRCPFLQTVSGPVKRREDVRDPEMLAHMQARDTVLAHGPRDINCTYDRSCNLSCPSCRSAIIVEVDAKDEILGIQQKLNDEALKDAHVLSITGSGDPFGSPFFRKWLQTMRVEDMPALQRIHLHTNAQLWTPTMWETIPAGVRALVKTAEISIDGASAETYSVNRRGGDFDKLLRNLEFVASLRRSGDLRRLKVSMVVQANNFGEMPAFLELGKRFAADCVYYSQLVNWGTFSQAEFEDRAVHLESHALHASFLRVLAEPTLNDPVADLGNLTAAKKRGEALALAAMAEAC